MPEIPEWAMQAAGNVLLNAPEDELLIDSVARALVEQMESIIAGIRRMKYSDRGEGLEDMDPHCDDHPDYERAMLDEFAEEIIASIRAARPAGKG